MKSRLALALVIAAAIAAYFGFDLGQWLSLETLRAQQLALVARVNAQPWLGGLAFFAAYVTVAALSLPGAAIMTLLAGAIFGFWRGLAIVSFASSLGATLAFLSARFLLRDWVQDRFAPRLQAINAGVTRDGAFYLFALRLVPLFPFVLVNLLMGLTPIRPWTFYWVSQLGMLAGTAVFVNAGTTLAQVDSPQSILSPSLLLAFGLLGVFPLLARKLLDSLRARQVYARWRAVKPRRFDRNLVVIGAGAAGLVTSYIAATVRAKVTLVEKHKMGGDCLNTGCVPSKALIRSATLLAQIRRAADYGLRSAHAEWTFAEVMARVQRVIRAVEPHDSVERYRALGVDCQQGSARIVSPWTVEITGNDGSKQLLTTKSIVIATGARPWLPPIAGLDSVDCLTSDNLWQLQDLPGHLLVLGGGPIGCELAQCFARFGSHVTLVEMAPRLLMREDAEVAALVAQSLAADGVTVLTDHAALRVQREPDGSTALICRHDGGEHRLPFDRILVAVGRRAQVDGLGLDALGIPLRADGTIETNACLQTIYPNIYACGDVAGPFQFTHTAAHQAWYAAVNALFGALRRFRADYRVIPCATFTDPEVARVGLTEAEAQARNIPHEVTRYHLDDLDRAIADGHARGIVKVITPPGKDTVLGATIVGAHASDMLVEYVAAMQHGFGLNQILGTVHAYPSMAEANKYAAGQWKRAHAPQRLLGWVAQWHAWQRGSR